MSDTTYSSEGMACYLQVVFYEVAVRADTTCSPLVAQYVPVEYTDEKEVAAIWLRLKDIKHHSFYGSTT